MNYRSFGKTDLNVSELGLGCQSLGGGLYYRDDRESIRTLHQAFDFGVNFYDTSDHYSQGASEILIGRAFKGKRDKVVIATKAGTRYSRLGDLALRMRPLLRPMSRFFRPMKISLHLMRASQKHSDFSAEYLTNAVHRSLKRLRTDYLDIFQLHKPPTSTLEKGDFCETLEKLRGQGKIRYYGISCATVEDALICLRHPGISSVQVGISFLDQDAINKLLPVAREKKIAVIARNPRAQGHLTSTLSDIMAETYAENQKEVEDRINKAKKFQFLVNKDRTLAQAALQFVLRLDGVSTVLPRAINRQQLEETLGSFNAFPLTEEELNKIYSINS